MKVRNYEKNELIIFVIVIVFFIEVLLTVFLFKYRVYKYKTLTGIVSNKNLVTLIVSKKEKNMLNKNRKIYIDNKYLNYKIVEDKGYITKKNKTKYYEIIIKVKTKKDINEVVELSIKNKKTIIIKLLKNIWEGG